MWSSNIQRNNRVLNTAHVLCWSPLGQINRTQKRFRRTDSEFITGTHIPKPLVVRPKKNKQKNKTVTTHDF